MEGLKGEKSGWEERKKEDARHSYTQQYKNGRGRGGGGECKHPHCQRVLDSDMLNDVSFYVFVT